MNELLGGIAALLPQDRPALVGVSGGADSMVLLHLLAHKHKVHVAHLNHQLRGCSSDADERLVRRTAEKLRFPCHVERADVKALAREQKLSIEMAARKCRHEFYARLARKLGIQKIALAHHADDQVELFFLRLLRGSGPEGLAGMPQASPSPADSSLIIVRPLLAVTKDEICAYASEHKIQFHEDVTNASLSILRNRIRHKLIPLLKRHYQPALTQTVLRVMELLRAESDFVGASARQGERLREPLEKLPLALQRRRLQQQLYATGIDANFDLIEYLRLNRNSGITVAPGRIVARDASGAVQLSRPPVWTEDRLSASVATPGSIDFSGITVRWARRRNAGLQTGKSRDMPMSQSAGAESFDADKIGDTIVLRRWQPGDRFQPIGMRSRVKLQDLFTNLKIPRGQRHQLVVATIATGEIFWVEGLRISEQFKVTPSTSRVLQWSWRRNKAGQP